MADFTKRDDGTTMVRGNGVSMLVSEKQPTRKCGDCQLCCRLLPMRARQRSVHDAALAMIEHGMISGAEVARMTPEFDKPAGARCPYQRHRKGCSIYARRPFGCKVWSCRWLVDEGAVSLSRPDRSHYVVDMMTDFITADPNDGTPPVNIEVVQVWVDPDHPDAWRDPALLAYLDRQGEQGRATLIRWDSSRSIAVFPPSMCGDGQWHEQGGTSGPEHTGEEKIVGIMSAARVKMGTGP